MIFSLTYILSFNSCKISLFIKIYVNDEVDWNQASGLKLLPWRLNLDGSNGWPLKGDPYASQAFFKAYICFYSSDVGRPFCFCCWSYMIFLIAPCVSSSKSDNGLVLFTFEVSIYGSPLNTVLQILSWAFYRFKVKSVLPPSFSSFHRDSEALIFSYSCPSIITSPVFFLIDTKSFLNSTWIYIT